MIELADVASNFMGLKELVSGIDSSLALRDQVLELLDGPVFV